MKTLCTFLSFRHFISTTESDQGRIEGGVEGVVTPFGQHFFRIFWRDRRDMRGLCKNLSKKTRSSCIVRIKRYAEFLVFCLSIKVNSRCYILTSQKLSSLRNAGNGVLEGKIINNLRVDP